MDLKTDLLGLSHGLTMHDVSVVRRRFETAKIARNALGYTDFVRIDSDAVSELLVSVAFTSSLIGYRRDGEPWRLDGVSPSSADGRKLVNDMDAIRERMLAMSTSMRRYMTHYAVTRRAKIAAAILVLSLDGCEDAYRPFYVQFSGVRPGSQDPQGDAQQRAEDHFGDPAVSVFGAGQE